MQFSGLFYEFDPNINREWCKHFRFYFITKPMRPNRQGNT